MKLKTYLYLSALGLGLAIIAQDEPAQHRVLRIDKATGAVESKEYTTNELATLNTDDQKSARKMILYYFEHPAEYAALQKKTPERLALEQAEIAAIRDASKQSLDAVDPQRAERIRALLHAIQNPTTTR